jgi:hypothetical protein
MHDMHIATIVSRPMTMMATMTIIDRRDAKRQPARSARSQRRHRCAIAGHDMHIVDRVIDRRAQPIATATGCSSNVDRRQRLNDRHTIRLYSKVSQPGRVV